MTELTELFTKNDMNKLKCELAKRVQTKEYKTIITLFRSNPNIWMLDNRELNEEIRCNDRHFTKPKGILKFETKTTTNNTFKLIK